MSEDIRLVSKELCKVIAIPRSKFIEILQYKNFQDDCFKFNRIRDNIVFNKSCLEINLNCYVCNS